MEAWIALGIVGAWLSAGPGLNEPRPQSAQPLPSVVVPAAAEAAFIPPAPLPELGILQIHFELAAPESCQDSRVHPPAPPAELDTVDLGGLLLESNNHVIRTGAFEIHLVGADDAEESAECPAPIPFQFLPESDVIFRKGTPLPAQLFSSELPSPPEPELSLNTIQIAPQPSPAGTIKLFLGEPQTQFFLATRLEAREAAAEDGCSSPVAVNPPVNKDVVQHLQAAIQHLEATGTYLEEADLKRALDMLRLGREQAVEKLLRQQRQELEAKEAELQRLKYEVEQLKKDLMTNIKTPLPFQFQHFVLRLEALRTLEKEATGDLQHAAQLVLERLTPGAGIPQAWSDDAKLSCDAAVRLLMKEGVAVLRNALITNVDYNSQITVIGGFEDQTQPIVNPDGRARRPDSSLTVKPEPTSDGRFDCELTYDFTIRNVDTWKAIESLSSDGRPRVSITAEPGSPTFGRLGIGTAAKLTPGEWQIFLCNPSVPRPGAAADEFADLMMARIDFNRSEKKSSAAFEKNAARPGSPDGRVRLTDAAEELAPSLGVQPLSNDQPAPSKEPVRELINPSFYVGGAPRHIQEAWQKAFNPAPPVVSIVPYGPPLGGAPPSPVVPASSEDDSNAVRLPPSPRPVPFQLVPSPPVAGGTLILIPVPMPTPSLVPDLGEPTSEPPSDDGPSA